MFGKGKGVEQPYCGGLERYYNQILFHRDDEGGEKTADHRTVGNSAYSPVWKCWIVCVLKYKY